MGIPRLQLPEHDAREAVHLHDAHAAGRRLESDSVQPFGLHSAPYGTNYIETLRVQLHANCRIRRIYFSDRLYSEEELPPEFKLFLPANQKGQAAAQPQA